MTTPVSNEPRIVIGFHSTGMCPTQFALDLARCMRYSGTIIPFALHEQSCYVDSARNNLVRNFLKSDAHYLMMMDVDVSFEPQAVLNTYEILRAQNAEVCYGNYSLGNGGNSIFGPPENASREAAVLVKLLPNVVYTDISTGGTGWVMIARPLLERMEKEIQDPWHWFGRDRTTDGLDYRGEDVTFGLRVWHLNPRPKMIGITTNLLRHLKQMPFIPGFMGPMAQARNLAAYASPNPYEDETKFIINGHQVLERKALTPLQAEEVEKQIKARKEAEANAVGSGHAQVRAGDAPQQTQEGTEGQIAVSSHCDYVEREGEGGGREAGIPEQAKEEKAVPAN